MRELERAYVDAWLAGDPEGVLNAFANDAVIIPLLNRWRRATGREPIE